MASIMDTAAAEMIAIKALAYLAQGEDRLARFLEATGLTPDGIRQSAASPTFLRGVLDYVMSDEMVAAGVTAQLGLPVEGLVAARGLICGKIRGPDLLVSEIPKPRPPAPKRNEMVTLMRRRQLYAVQPSA